MTFAARVDPDLEPRAIRSAVSRIHPSFAGSPHYLHEGLSARAGIPIVLKVECVNAIRAFKGRGTWLAVDGLVGEGRAGPGRPLVCASTGNFGQGVAFAGRAFGVPVIVYADEHANSLKVGRIEALGAEVVRTGQDFDAARVAAERHATAHGATLLVDGEDPRIAAGAATLAVEVTDAVAADRLPAIGSAYIPVGNGALVVGVGAWLRHAAPACRVIGVQSEAAPSMTLSWRAGHPIETASAATSAEGIATRVPVPQALEMMVGRVDDMVLVTESAIEAARRELTSALGITVEGAAAAAWAGLLEDPERRGPALLIVTGSNVVES